VKLIVIRKAKWREKSIDEQLEPLPPFLTLEQIVELLDISGRTLYRILKNPKEREDLGAFKYRGKWVIPKVGLIEFLQWRNFFNWEETKRRLKGEPEKEDRKP